MEQGNHNERLTDREQKILFQHWENQQKQEVAQQSEPTVRDIAEACGMPPEEVARQLRAVRADEALRAEAARQQRVRLLRTVRQGITGLVLLGLGWLAATRLPFLYWPGMAASAAARHDRQGARDLYAGDFAAAEREETRAVQEEPNEVVYRVNLGHALFNQKKYALALPQYQEAVRLEPGSARYEQYLADTLMDLNRLPEAIAAFRAVLSANPSNAGAESGLGECFARMHKYDEAEAAYRASLALSPANADTLDGLGAALGEQRRIAEAATYFRQAVALAPDNAEYRRNLELAEQMLRQGTKYSLQLNSASFGLRSMGTTAAIPARRYTDHPLEVSREVTLISKADLECCLAERHPKPKQTPRPFHTNLVQVSVRRQADLRSEDAQQVKGTETG